VVFAQVGDTVCQKEIPADGDTGGNVWFSALSRFLKDIRSGDGCLALDVNKSTAHGGVGYGWNRIYLDDITIPNNATNSNLTYGVTLDSNIVQQYGKPTNWFSACDFIVERVGE
jgi:hypothetical protein